MKILFVTRSIYPNLIGGLEKFASEYYENMVKKSDIDLLAGKRAKRLSLTFLVRAVIFLVFCSRKYDIIHFRDALIAPLLPIVRLFSQSKVVFTVHGLDIVYPNRIYQWIIPKLLNRADKIYCVSRYTKLQCLKRNIDANKLRVITNGFDFNKIIRANECIKTKIEAKFQLELIGKKTLLTVGRLAERKGHAWLIKNVIPKLPQDYIYLIAGGGPELETIKNVIGDMGMEGRVHILGLVSEVDKNCLYKISDWFIMPNIHVPDDQEGFGIVIIEAGGYGLPVIASDIEGISDAVIDGVTGFLLPEKDAQAYVDTILNGSLDLQNIPKAVRDHYSWESISDKYLEEFKVLYEEGS